MLTKLTLAVAMFCGLAAWPNHLMEDVGEAHDRSEDVTNLPYTKHTLWEQWASICGRSKLKDPGRSVVSISFSVLGQKENFTMNTVANSKGDFCFALPYAARVNSVTEIESPCACTNEKGKTK